MLVPIPGGSIELRDARSGSARTVELLPFALGRTQVTRAAWLAVMDDAGTPPPPVNVRAHPVTWFDAIAWCNRASALAGLTPAYSLDGREVGWDVSADGYRLPTEAELEWAVRAGTVTPVHGPLAGIAWTALDEVRGPSRLPGRQQTPLACST